MTIKIDHIKTDRSEDPGFWYLWALDFNNTFRFLFTQRILLQKKSYNVNIDPPLPSSIAMWCLYAQALELYMKTYLLAIKAVPLQALRSSSKYGHDLENLRKKCAESEPKFDEKYITWITKDLRKFTDMGWEDIKYPPKRPPLNMKPKLLGGQHLPGMYGKETMIPPLDLLEGIVKPLVYIED